jgi:hypothetical protein
MKSIFTLMVVLPILLLSTVSAQAFSDTFAHGSLDRSKWNIAVYPSPDSKPGINRGVYTQDTLDFSQGLLRITVSQSMQGGEAQSIGGGIISKDLFGYGTYTFVMRQTSTAEQADRYGVPKSGAVSSGFLYKTNSESEIDLEFLGDQNALWVSLWMNPTPSIAPNGAMKVSDKVTADALGTKFCTYTLVWTKTDVTVLIDGIQVARQTEHIPHAPAHIILQHRGTNSSKWGGLASPGITRYFYVKSVTFTPGVN